MEITPIEFSSERIEIGKALLKAQANIEPFKKESTNPAYQNSRYADLATVLDAIKGALQGAGVVLLQGGAMNGEKVAVETTLLHAESGQWARNILTLTPVADARNPAITPQTIGKCLTYGRRYGLQALLGIAAEDDDGNEASAQSTPATVREYKLAPQGTVTEQAGGLTEISGKLTNWREKKYPPDNKNPEGSVVYFGNLGTWTIWAKEKELVEGLANAQGKQIEVVGKRSKNRENMFEVVSWTPAEGLE